MQAHLIYSEKYDFSFGLLNKLHPFDGVKFSKAWHIVNAENKTRAQAMWIEPTTATDNTTLLAIHSDAYLTSLQKSATIEKVLEIGITRFIPNGILQKILINPLRMACAGTVLATETALANKSIAMNFGGGYHHTFPERGEGFCFFGDAALGIVNSRHKKLINTDDKILMIDLDAHRGNGFFAFMGEDPAVQIFDMYNFQTYPGLLRDNADKHPYIIPLKAGIQDDQYLTTLKTRLTHFLNEHQDAKLVYYNAGNDIYEQDILGKLSISYDGVLERDNFVLTELTSRQLPTVIMTSGGYTKTSHRFIAELAKAVIKFTD